MRSCARSGATMAAARPSRSRKSWDVSMPRTRSVVSLRPLSARTTPSTLSLSQPTAATWARLRWRATAAARPAFVSCVQPLTSRRCSAPRARATSVCKRASVRRAATRGGTRSWRHSAAAGGSSSTSRHCVDTHADAHSALTSPSSCASTRRSTSACSSGCAAAAPSATDDVVRRRHRRRIILARCRRSVAGASARQLGDCREEGGGKEDDRRPRTDVTGRPDSDV